MYLNLWGFLMTAMWYFVKAIKKCKFLCMSLLTSELCSDFMSEIASNLSLDRTILQGIEVTSSFH